MKTIIDEDGFRESSSLREVETGIQSTPLCHMRFRERVLKPFVARLRPHLHLSRHRNGQRWKRLPLQSIATKRRYVARGWRMENAYDLSEPKESPPQDNDYQGWKLMKLAHRIISPPEAADELLCLMVQVQAERIQVAYLHCVIWLRIRGCTPFFLPAW